MKGIKLKMPNASSESGLCVVGLGYIGLPTAVSFASKSLKVTGVDTSVARVRAVNEGLLPFSEPGLDKLLSDVVSKENLEATLTPVPAENYIIAVPTPVKKDHSVDLSYIFAAADSISPVLRGDELIILESTVPPGTTEKLKDRILANRTDLRAESTGAPGLRFAHCPERVLPGKIMSEIHTNDRIVGGLTPQSSCDAKKLYGLISEGAIMTTDARTAELAKLTENTYRDINIAFANELSIIAENQGVDVWELIELANRHPRVNILRPGPGVGGHCIAVDPWFIVSSDPNNSPLISTARRVNLEKPEHVTQQVLDEVRGEQSPAIVFLGLSFKANVDDVRESPSVTIISRVASRLPQARISVIDPHVKEMPADLAKLKNVNFVDDYSCMQKANVIVLLVDHSDFYRLDWSNLPSGCRVVDTKGMLRNIEKGNDPL